MNRLELLRGVLAHISTASPWALLLLKATLLLAVGWLVHFSMARANPRWRTLLWRGTAVGVVLMAVWTLGLPSLEIRVQAPEPVATSLASSDSKPLAEFAPALPTVAEARPIQGPASVEMTATTPQATVDARPEAARSGETSEPLRSWRVVLLIVWGIGAVILAIRLALAYHRLTSLLQTSQAAPAEIMAEVERIAAALGCRRTVQVRSLGQSRENGTGPICRNGPKGAARKLDPSPFPAVPFLYGLRRPVLVLPERMCQPAYREELPGVIAHELAHVGSNDFGWNAALRAVSTVLWFHPLVWRIGSAHRAACDAVCDAVSASHLGNVQAYCRTLARVAFEGAASFPAAGLAMARTCDVRRRIAMLQQRVFAASLGRRTVIGAALVGLLSVALLAGVRLALAEPTDSPISSDADEGRRDFSRRLQRAEDERITKARGEALRAAAEEAIKTGDQAAAARHCIELVLLPKPLLRDCRQAIVCLEAGTDWPSLAKAYDVAAEVMQSIIKAPPQSFTRPAPPEPPDSRNFGPTTEVQLELDGIWQKNCKGTAENWLDWIARKQQRMKQERFDVLWKLAQLYRGPLNDPKSAAAALRKSLADLPFFAMPLEKLIADEWPPKERDIGWKAEMGVYLPAACELVTALERNNDLDAAVDMQNRIVMAKYSSGGMQRRDVEKLWWLLQQRPKRSPMPPVACINILSPERSSVNFDLDKLIGPRTYASKLQGKLLQLLIAAQPGLEFDAIEVAADMESKGGYVGVQCESLPAGTMHAIGGVKWYKDQRKGREVRTATVKIPAGTGVIYFGRAWIPGTDPDGIDVHRITVKATFRQAAASVDKSPFSARTLAAESAEAAFRITDVQALARRAVAQTEDAAKTSRAAAATPPAEQIPPNTAKASPGFAESIGMKFRLIPAGEFMMGSTAAENAPDPFPNEKIRRDDEGPVHRVRITKPFYLSAYEITQAQWHKVVGTNIADQQRGNPKHETCGPNMPMFWVTWYDAVAFCNRLSELEGRTPYYRLEAAKRRDNFPSIIEATVTVAGGNGYRLPTEAQWEYACRAGTTTPYAVGKTLTEADASISGQCKDVGSYRSNAWGLYDMHGNVAEWCQDWRGWDYYKKSPMDDPVGPTSGRGRVVRGGSCSGFSGWCRSAHRTENFPGSPMSEIGFRVAVNAGEQPKTASAADGATSLADAVRAINRQAGKLPESRVQEPLTEDEITTAIDGLAHDKRFSDAEHRMLRQVAETRRLPKNVALRQFVRYNDGTDVQHGWWVRLLQLRDDGPALGVMIRENVAFRRPYTQRERLFQAEVRRTGRIPTLNRLVAYFDEDPKFDAVQPFSQQAADRLADAVKRAIGDGKTDDLLKTYHWEGVDSSSRKAIGSEAEKLVTRKLSSVSVSPRRFGGHLEQWQGLKTWDANLPVLGYVVLEFADGNWPTSVWLEFSETPDGARLANYIVSRDDGPRMVGKRPSSPIHVHGVAMIHPEKGWPELQFEIEAPPELPALQNANFEVWNTLESETLPAENREPELPR